MSTRCAVIFFSILAVTAEPLIFMSLFPSEKSLLLIIRTSSSQSTESSSAAFFASGLSETVNSATTELEFSPYVIIVLSDFAPKTKLSASITTDFPAPVSPDKMFRPAVKSICASSINAMEPRTCGIFILSITIPAALALPLSVFTTIKLLQQVMDTTISLNKETIFSESAAFLISICAYLYFLDFPEILIRFNSLISRETVACVTSIPRSFSFAVSSSCVSISNSLIRSKTTFCLSFLVIRYSLPLFNFNNKRL